MKATTAIEENERVQVTAESACKHLFVGVAKVRCHGVHGVPDSNVPEAITGNGGRELTRANHVRKQASLRWGEALTFKKGGPPLGKMVERVKLVNSATEPPS